MVIGSKQYRLLDLLKISFQCSPVCTILEIVRSVIEGSLPAMQVLVTSTFIDMAIRVAQNQAAVTEIYPALLGVVAVIGCMWLLGSVTKFAQVKAGNDIRKTFRTAIVEKRAQLAFEHLEDTTTWDLIARVSKEPEVTVQNGLRNTLDLLSNVFKVVSILMIVSVHVWWAGIVIVLLSVPILYLAILGGKATYDANKEATQYERKYQYLSEVLTGRETVEERSLFSYSEDISQKWWERYENARKIKFLAQLKWFIRMKSGALLYAVLGMLVAVVLISPVIEGLITIGLFISLISVFVELVNMMAWSIPYFSEQLTVNREYCKDLSTFANLSEVDGTSDKAPAPIFESLVFDRVSFKYPKTESYILKDFSLVIEANKHYAFVGANGSGKTTLTKLLTGLYQEYEGSITINGKEITSYTQSELKAFFSVVYQDFAKYYISFRDNIRLGDIQNNPDITAAVAQLDLQDAVADLPQGENTVLGKIKENGVDLSYGQWQRIAMARAIVNPAPFRILDEPTSALDPISESNMYEKYAEISENKTTIFISHRLGSTKLAEKIFVIGGGKVVEEGTHKELMNQNGLYAEMFESQRSWYE